jgi:O-antigen ligase
MLPLQQRTLCGAVTALALACLVPAVADVRVPGWERLIVVGFAAAAAFAPRAAALVLVAAIPLAFLGPPVSGSSFRLLEAIVVAAICGWAARGAAGTSARRLAGPLWTFLSLAVVLLGCSAIVVTASGTTLNPHALHAAVVRAIAHDFFVDRGVLEPASTALVQLEAVMLFTACAVLAVARPSFVRSFVRMLVAGAAGAALLNLQRLAQIVLRAGAPLHAMRDTFRKVRINVSYRDVNAAGSFFALAGVAAARVAITRNAAGAAIGAVTAAVIVAAMWLTGSRAAVAAVLAACVCLMLVARPSRRRRLAVGATLAACGLGAAVFVLLFPNRIVRPPTSIGLLTRTEMAAVALRMTADHPWFGVGVGRFYDSSASYLASTRLASIYPQENAHNNYLQVLAETGIIGAMIVLGLLVASCRQAVRGLRDAGAARVALVGGLGAFGLTMLFGHPLLMPEVCYVFALAAGVATGAGVPQTPAASDRRSKLTAIAAMAAAVTIAATVPFRVHSARASANFDQVAWGTGPWQIGPDGQRARSMNGSVTLFVPANVAIVEIPFRLDHPGPAVTLSVRYRDHAADPIVVRSTEWSRYRLVIGGEKREARYEELILVPQQAGDATNVLLGKLVEY